MREALIEALALKALPRAGWVRVCVPDPESVAAHSWGVATLVLVLCPPDLDRERALAIALVHDLAEVRVGDLTPHDGVPRDEKARREREAFVDLVAALPNAEELTGCFDDYGVTAEGRFVQACDKLDMALQAAAYERGTDLDLSEFVDSALSKLSAGVLRELARGAPETR